MQTGAITGYIDVAQVVLYAFWIFFAGLIFYLRREDKREGYPLESDRSAQRHACRASRRCPSPKTFLLRDGGTRHRRRRAERDQRRSRAAPGRRLARRAAGADRQSDARRRRPWRLGERADVPDLTFDGDAAHRAAARRDRTSCVDADGSRSARHAGDRRRRRGRRHGERRLGRPRRDR